MDSKPKEIMNHTNLNAEALELPVTFWVMPHSDFKMRTGDTFHISFEGDLDSLSSEMHPM